MSHTIHHPTKEELRIRLRKIEGQVRGLERMLDRDEGCTDVLTQIASARAALSAVGFGLVDCEVRRIVIESEPARRDAAASEVLAAVNLLVHG
ncbi:MAG TPA: metal-sensitive transcriptional regulator [Ilumatobacteraceae bacterium]